MTESGFLSFGTRPGPPWSTTRLIKWVLQLFLEVKPPGRAFGHSLLPRPQVTTSRLCFHGIFE